MTKQEKIKKISNLYFKDLEREGIYQVLMMVHFTEKGDDDYLLTANGSQMSLSEIGRIFAEGICHLYFDKCGQDEAEDEKMIKAIIASLALIVSGGDEKFAKLVGDRILQTINTTVAFFNEEGDFDD